MLGIIWGYDIEVRPLTILISFRLRFWPACPALPRLRESFGVTIAFVSFDSWINGLSMCKRALCAKDLVPYPLWYL